MHSEMSVFNDGFFLRIPVINTDRCVSEEIKQFHSKDARLTSPVFYISL